MEAVTMIFPHQLFRNHPALEKTRPVYLVEEWLFFRQYRFHKQKLLLHRASMQFYRNWLQRKGYTVHYIDTTGQTNDCRHLIRTLAEKKVRQIHLADVADNWLDKRTRETCAKNNIELHIYYNPGFLRRMEEVEDFFKNRETYFMADFYTWQRKSMQVLVQQDGKPAGGKWSFDADNRKKIPAGHSFPGIRYREDNEYLEEARLYIEKHFPDNPGIIQTKPLFAVTYDAAEKWLSNFLKERFQLFGDYEDAIVARQYVLYHSVLSPMLNNGLLTPDEVMDKALEAAPKYDIPLNSLEGFIRQIIGWREFIRIVYIRAGVRQRTKNFWQFKRKLPYSFRTGETGILPVDTTIKKILQTGYCHHIERLMILGNFMLLCEFDPDDVYRWFMEMFIDAYDWVMVPNVYGMTQFADGGLMTTKPYISGSNYIKKMSDYVADKENGRATQDSWDIIWDGLFWRFMNKHRAFFQKNPRLGMLVSTFDKMPAAKQRSHLDTAHAFLRQLDESG